jgi:hypothetical protein
VNKNVWAIRSSDEPISFCVIEPPYRAFHTFLAYIQSPRIRSLGIPETIANYDASLPNSALDSSRSLAAAFCRRDTGNGRRVRVRLFCTLERAGLTADRTI